MSDNPCSHLNSSHWLQEGVFLQVLSLGGEGILPHLFCPLDGAFSSVSRLASLWDAASLVPVALPCASLVLPLLCEAQLLEVVASAGALPSPALSSHLAHRCAACILHHVFLFFSKFEFIANIFKLAEFMQQSENWFYSDNHPVWRL